MYEQTFEIILSRVNPARDSNRNEWLKTNWWKLQRIRPELRSAIDKLPRFIATPRVAKHRIFAWFFWPVITDDQTLVFARSDDFFFDVLHSRVHEAWSLAQGTQLREKESGFRYTPTTCFETFPFPWDHRLSAAELSPEQQTCHARISEASARSTISAPAGLTRPNGRARRSWNSPRPPADRGQSLSKAEMGDRKPERPCHRGILRAKVVR